MEVVGGVAACVELAKVAVEIGKYINHVEESSGARLLLAKEINQVEANVEWVKQQRMRIHLDVDNPAYPPFRRLLNRSNKSEWQYGELLQAVYDLLKGLQKRLHVGEEAPKREGWRHYLDKAKRGGSALKWPIVEDETKETTRTLMRLNQEIHNVIGQATFLLSQSNHATGQSNMMIGQANLEANTQNLVISQANHTLAKEQSTDIAEMKVEMGKIVAGQDEARRRGLEKDFLKILQWISPSKTYDPASQIPDDERIPGDWIFQDEIVQAWEKGKPWSLRLYGKAGCGKTMLASFIAKRLRAKLPSDGSEKVFSLFLKYEDQSTQSYGKLAAFLLRQVLAQTSGDQMPSDIAEEWHQASRDGTHLETAVVNALLVRELARLRRSYILVDGLDEASEDLQTELPDQLEQLQNLLREQGSKSSLLYTSRPSDIEPDKTPSCDKCDPPAASLRIYYKCRIHAEHGNEYHLCERHASEHSDCDLHEPYKSLDFELRPPDDVIRDYIAKMLHKSKTLGTAGRSGNFEEIGKVTNMSVVGTTSLGRVLGQHNDPKLEAKIVNKIVKTADGSFFFARAHWNTVKTASKRSEILDALDNLPKTFDDTYKDALKRIKEHHTPANAAKGLRVIMWLSYAKRVLKYTELRHALSVQAKHALQPPEDMEEEDLDLRVFDRDDLEDMETFFAATAGLVHVTETGVRLMHQSAYKFFERADVRKDCFNDDGDREMAAACLSYLMHTDMKSPCFGDDEESQLAEKHDALPLSWYASQLWGYHASKAQADEALQKLVMTFFNHETALASATQMSSFAEPAYPTNWLARSGVSQEHVAAWYGLDNIIEKYLHSRDQANLADGTGHGRTPLIYASRGGHESTIELLLRLGAYINLADGDGWTPLRHAVDLGRAESVTALCRDLHLDVNVVGPDGETCLMAAVKLPNSSVIRALGTAPRINPSQVNANGFTALMLGAMDNELYENVKALLRMKKSVELDATDTNGYTALHWAARNDHRKAVHCLLEKGADGDIRSKRGSTALMLAVECGFKSVIEEFDLHGAVDTACVVRKDGWTLLHGACNAGHHEIAEWLLNRGAAVNALDACKRTPLHLAAREGHDKVVRVLLKAGADVTCEDQDGHSAADLALQEGLPETADLIDPPGPGESREFDVNGLPTVILAKRGFIGPLKRRITESEHSVRETDGKGNTPLHLAVEHGHDECVRAILEDSVGKDVASAVNVDGQSPVGIACDKTNSDVVQMLIAHDPRPNLEIVDNTCQTALGSCLDSGDYESAVALIGADARIDYWPDMPQDVLSAAVEAQDEHAVERLIAHGLENTYRDRDRAAQLGDQGIITMLNRARTFGPNMPHKTIALDMDEYRESDDDEH